MGLLELLVLILVYLAIPILAIAWLLSWRRQNRERLSDIQNALSVSKGR